MKRIHAPLALLPALLLAACASTDEPEIEGPSVDADPEPISVPALLDEAWQLTVAVEGDVRINGVACGELDADAPGDEIVTVDQRGQIRMFRLALGDFVEMKVGALQAYGDEVETQGMTDAPTGELVQVICADIVPRVAGDEIIAVGVLEGGEDDGGRGLVRVLVRSGPDRAWREYRHVTPALVHAVAAGEIVPSKPGIEFLVAGFWGEAEIGSVSTIPGDIRVTYDRAALTHSGNAKGACVIENGLVLACDDGHLVEYRRAERTGPLALYDDYDLEAPLARIAPFPEGGVVVCDNDGFFRHVRRDPERRVSQSTMLARSDNRFRGAVVGDFDPGEQPFEAATAGYDGTIRLVSFIPTEGDPSIDWIGQRYATSESLLARDTAKIHHLTSGRFDGMGLCLVSCGYSGDVLVLSRTGQ
ncbi:MAG: hypothetical protein AAGA20_06290 [Planctomycetota bacterium]